MTDLTTARAPEVQELVDAAVKRAFEKLVVVIDASAKQMGNLGYHETSEGMMSICEIMREVIDKPEALRKLTE